MGFGEGLTGVCLVHRLAEDSPGAPEVYLSTDGKRIGVPKGS